MMIDRFGRVHDYLRISLTDTCNLRCTYCMPENQIFAPKSSLMSADEVVAFSAAFVKLGVNKIRLTGGEPLVRSDFAEIISRIAELKSVGLKTLTLTTNGILLHQRLQTILDAGVEDINVSLDTLMPDRFLKMTRRDQFHKVMSNIHLLLDNQVNTKINVVVMSGINDDEVFEFIHFTRDYPIEVRFIEFMPFEGNNWRSGKMISSAALLKRASDHFELIPVENSFHGTAKIFRVLGYTGKFGFISTMTAPFCEGCNRIRLTADGKIKNCLFSKGEMDLLSHYRNGIDIKAMIEENILAKEERWGGQSLFENTANRPMVAIGG